jgi:hypothetical protein
LTGTAVKTTVVPAHTLLAEAETATLTGSNGFTVMATTFEAAGLFEMQTVIEDVSMHCTWSPLAGAYANTGLLLPVPIPFTFHW